MSQEPQHSELLKQNALMREALEAIASEILATEASDRDSPLCVRLNAIRERIEALRKVGIVSAPRPSRAGNDISPSGRYHLLECEEDTGILMANLTQLASKSGSSV